MNITAERADISTEARNLSKKVEEFRAGLLSLIQDLPDNPAVTRVSEKCYQISSKNLTQTFVGRKVVGMTFEEFKKKNKDLTEQAIKVSWKEKTTSRIVNSVWAPEMHDFKHQYKRIAVILNSKGKFEDICRTLDRIIDDGGYTTHSTEWGLRLTWPERFHPGVIENIRKIWRPEDGNNCTQ